MRQYVFNLLCVCALIGGCTHPSSTSSEIVETIHVEENLIPQIPIEQLFGECKYLPITPRENMPLIGEVTKALICQDAIAVSDYKAVHFFDLSGQYINSVSRYGRGGEEYLGIVDFSVIDSSLFVLDQNKKLVRYSLKGEYVSSTILDFFPASLTAYDGDRILLSSAYQSEFDKFHIYDLTSLERITSFCPVDENQITWRHFRGQTNYYRYNNMLVFHEPMNNTVYHLKDTTAIPVRCIDLFNRNAPDGFWSKKYNSVLEINREANDKSYCFGIPTYSEDDNTIWFTYRDGASYRLCLLSKKTKDSFQSEEILFTDLGCSFPVGSVVYSLESNDLQLMVLPGDALKEEIKTKLLKVSPDYDDLVFVLKR